MTKATKEAPPEETALATIEAAPVNIFDADEAVEVVARATKVADTLAPVIQAKKLYATIGGKRHVTVEGWTLLGSMLGVFPVTVWTKGTEQGWTARVEARTLAGQVVGAAEASCNRTEAKWKKADDYAIQSMAQTRATSKCLRLPLGFVMTLAGYEVTPAEEVPHEAAPEPVAPITDAQAEVIVVLAKETGHDLGKLLEQAGIKHLRDMTEAGATRWIDRFQELKAADSFVNQPVKDPL